MKNRRPMPSLLISLFGRTDLALFSPNRRRHQFVAPNLAMFIDGQYVEA